MRQSASIILTILGAGGAALGWGVFNGGTCRDSYATMEKCVAVHGTEKCLTEATPGQGDVVLGPARRCSVNSGYHSYYGYGSGYYPGIGGSRSGSGSFSAPSSRGGFGGTGHGFSSGG